MDVEQLKIFKVNVVEERDVKRKRIPSFHELMGPILAVAQCFGHLPACGIFQPDSNNIYFKWSAFRVIYAMILIAIGGFEVALMFKRAFKHFTIVQVELIMFYGFGVIRMCIFLYLSTQWREIMIYWSKKEKPFLDLPYTRLKGVTLSMKIRLIGVLFFVLFLIEHLLFQVLMESVSQYQMKTCNVTTITALNNFMRIVRPHLLDVLPYHWSLFVIFQWLISSLAFGWNFVDYFLIIISLGISTRFTQINQRLKRAQMHEMNHKFWIDTRIHYTNLVDLLQFVDEKIAPLMLLCMTQNLFLVCTKVFEAIRFNNRQFTVEYVYFFFYLFFLLFRTLMLLYSCSSVHESALYPLQAIRKTTFWSVNVKRLSDLIQTENIALSGNEFFFFTRRLILAMIGSVVTFELVLLDRGNRGDENDSLCAFFNQTTPSK